MPSHPVRRRAAGAAALTARRPSRARPQAAAPPGAATQRAPPHAAWCNNRPHMGACRSSVKGGGGRPGRPLRPRPHPAPKNPHVYKGKRGQLDKNPHVYTGKRGQLGRRRGPQSPHRAHRTPPTAQGYEPPAPVLGAAGGGGRYVHTRAGRGRSPHRPVAEPRAPRRRRRRAQHSSARRPMPSGTAPRLHMGACRSSLGGAGRPSRPQRPRTRPA